jgi:hypothetical protein
MVSVFTSTTGGRDLQECIAEAREEILRLEIEVGWCAAWLQRWTNAPTA